jgi:hypothetical protein
MNAQDIFQCNPYEDHPSLTPLEADVLWEYAKLSQHIKDVRTHAHAPRSPLLPQDAESRTAADRADAPSQ